MINSGTRRAAAKSWDDVLGTGDRPRINFSSGNRARGRAVGTGLLVVSLCASVASAESIYEASARQREHDSYVSQQSANNTRYFNNADSYPKTDTGNYLRLLQQQQAQRRPARNDWVPQPVMQVAEQHQQTPAEYFAQTKQKSAMGDLEAKLNLADCYYSGWGTPLDKAEAFRLYRALSSAKLHAAVMAGSMLFSGVGVAANEAEGLALVQRVEGKEAADWLAAVHPSSEQVERAAAAKNYAPMLYYALDLFYGKNDREHDIAKAVAYLQRGAASGDKTAASWLAELYVSPEAIEELKRRSAAGDNDARLKLADDYFEGRVGAINRTEAYRLYRETASADPRAEAMADAMLYTGDGVAADQTGALEKMKKAAAAGNPHAVAWLADTFPSPEAIEERAKKKDYVPMLGYASDLMYGKNGRTKAPEQAVTYFQRLVDAGYDPALLFLGAAYFSGHGVAEDLVRAQQLMLKADAVGEKEAPYHLAILAEVDAPAHPRDLAAMRQWAEKYLAANPSPEAFDLMGRLEYFSNQREKARGWWLKAVEAGCTFNQHELGFLEWSGKAGPVDEAAGRKHLEASAAEGEGKSMYELGVAYKGGLHGMPVDGPKAMRLFEEAAETNLSVAQNNLAMAYYTGDGVARDMNRAAVWAEKAAENGYANSQYVIGLLYESGEGVEADPVKAAQWMQKAADQGDGFAMCALAMDYNRGSGVAKDDVKAAQWAQQAAEHGSRNALPMLAAFYKYGMGVPKDPVKSVEWMQKAADSGIASARAEMAKGYNGQ